MAKHIGVVEVTNSKGTHFRRRQLVGRKDDNERAKKWLKNYKEKKSKEALNKQIDSKSKELRKIAEEHRDEVEKDLKESILNGEIEYQTLDDNGKIAKSTDFALKTENSIKEKIKKELSDGHSYSKATDLKDCLRYTDLVDKENLVNEYFAVRAQLLDKGYNEVRVRNTLNNDSKEKPYKGLNTIYETKDGYRFELQFHTQETLAAKEKVHGWYKMVENANTSQKDRDMYNDKIYNVYKEIEPIKNAERIKNKG